ncbi:MAG: transporter [Limisphaerales bacterium]
MKIRVLTPVAVATLSLWGTAPVWAEEGGAGHYVPGALATLIDLPPSKPGWAVEVAYLRYDGEAGRERTLPVAGLAAADLEATSDAFMLGGFHTFEKPVLGAWYSVGLFLPWVAMDVEATVTTSLGSRSRRDTENGLGDMTLLPIMLGWKKDDLQFDAVLSVYAPTGDYEAGRLANPGRNHWTFDPTIGVSYNGSKNGFNAAIHTGIAMNTENDETDYRSGSVWHVEASVQQLLPVGSGFLGVGFNAFYYDQFTGDSGSGATLGDFEGMTVGVGPVLNYVLPCGEDTLVIEGRWLPELDTRNRTEGDFFWLKVVFQF